MALSGRPEKKEHHLGERLFYTVVVKEITRLSVKGHHVYLRTIKNDGGVQDGIVLLPYNVINITQNNRLTSRQTKILYTEFFYVTLHMVHLEEPKETKLYPSVPRTQNPLFIYTENQNLVVSFKGYVQRTYR